MFTGRVRTLAQAQRALSTLSYETVDVFTNKAFGGNPLACAVACAVFDELAGGVLDHAKSMGERLGDGLAEIASAAGPDKVVEARGRGLLRGLAMKEAPGAIIDACRERGVLVISAGGNVLRLAPPLTILPDELDHGLRILRDVVLEHA